MARKLPPLLLDPSGGVPIYRQIMDQVRAYTATGVLKPGDQLPSIRDLAKTLRVNPTTIVHAYSELEHGGILERQQGRGVFVAATAEQVSVAEARADLRRMAERLAMDAVQLGVPLATVQRWMAEALSTVPDRERRQGENANDHGGHNSSRALEEVEHAGDGN